MFSSPAFHASNQQENTRSLMKKKVGGNAQTFRKPLGDRSVNRAFPETQSGIKKETQVEASKKDEEIDLSAYEYICSYREIDDEYEDFPYKLNPDKIDKIVNKYWKMDRSLTPPPENIMPNSHSLFIDLIDEPTHEFEWMNNDASMYAIDDKFPDIPLPSFSFQDI